MKNPLLRIAVAVVAASACSEKVAGPTMSDVAGTFALRSLSRFTSSDTAEYAPPDSHIDLVLAENGTVTGDMLLKGAGPGGADFTADMSGTWSLTGNRVTLTQAADNFLRDVPLTYLIALKELDGSFHDQTGTTWVFLTKQ